MQVEIRCNKQFNEGILFWIYPLNRKIYYSSKPFYETSFLKHDSNYFGKVEEWIKEKNDNHSELLKLLKQEEDKVFGYVDGKTDRSNNILKINFFATWEDMYSHGNQNISFLKKQIQESIKKRVGTFFSQNITPKSFNNQSQCHFNSETELDKLITKVVDKHVDLSYTKTMDIGWKIIELLQNNIKITIDIKDLSNIIVSAHLNKNEIEMAIKWVDRLIKFGHNLYHKK